MSDNESKSNEDESNASSSASDSESSSESESNQSNKSSSNDEESDNSHQSEDDTDPDLDPDGDIEFSDANPDVVLVTNDQWIRDRIRNRRRLGRVEQKKNRLLQKELKKIAKQRKLGLIKDPRSREVVLKESLLEIFNETGGYGVWNETRGWDGKVSRLSLVSQICDAVSNVAVIIVGVNFTSWFLFYCLLLNHSFQTDLNT